jgi:tripartite-type tricarboxylate transporter receptor subunit TctC
MSIFTRPVARILLAVLSGCAATGTAHADSFPDHKIRFVVPFGPGGSTDPVARHFTQLLSQRLGQSVYVDNRPGGGATIGHSEIVRSKPDGYTIGLGTTNALLQQPLVHQDLPYKSPADYQPIVKLVDLPLVLIVRADAPWKTFADFVQDAKEHPGKIRASTSGVGTLNDVLIAQLNKLSGAQIISVPFSNGNGAAMLSLLGGQVEANVGAGMAGLPFVRDGKARVLAVFAKKRYALFPDAVTTLEAGYDVTLQGTFLVFGPKGMPEKVLDELTSTSIEVAKSAEYQKFAVDNGYVPDPKGPAELSAELVETGKQYAEMAITPQ